VVTTLPHDYKSPHDFRPITVLSMFWQRRSEGYRLPVRTAILPPQSREMLDVPLISPIFAVITPIFVVFTPFLPPPSDCARGGPPLPPPR